MANEYFKSLLILMSVYLIRKVMFLKLGKEYRIVISRGLINIRIKFVAGHPK
jgi:hypothetical protein